MTQDHGESKERLETLVLITILDMPVQTSNLPKSVFSMTQSLASGIVRRLVEEWRVQNERFISEQHQIAKKHGKVPRLPKRRALCYRVLCERTKGIIPPRQAIAEYSKGNSDGLDKSARYAITHWLPSKTFERLDLVVTYVSPGWRLPRRWGILEITTHALRRLFFRLKTLDEEVVFTELAPAADTICRWLAIILSLIQEEPKLSIGLPTPNGLLLLARNNHRNSPHCPANLIAVTWVSDKRMNDIPERLVATDIARQEKGVIIKFEHQFWPLTATRNQDFLTFRKNFLDPYYQDMLTHLPPAS